MRASLSKSRASQVSQSEQEAAETQAQLFVQPSNIDLDGKPGK